MDIEDQLPDEEITEENLEEVDTEEVETEEVEKAEAETEADAEETDEVEEVLETVEVDGVEYEVPPALKASVMKNADYTQKTQTLAEEKAQFEAQKAEHQQSLEADEEFEDLRIEQRSVQKQLKQYENANWDQLETEDSDNANRHWRNFQLLQQRANDLNTKVTEKQSERTQSAQQAIAKRVEQAAAYAEKNIPKWSPDLANKIEAYALSQGFDQASLVTNLSPALMKTLYDGYIGQEIKTKAANPVKKKSNVVPLKQIKAKSGTQTKRKDPDNMSFDEYEKARKTGALK